MTNVSVPDEVKNARGQLQGWLQVDKAVHQKMWRFGLKNPSGLAILHFLVGRLHRGSNAVAISAAAMAEIMEISPRTVKNAVAALAKAKFIQILKIGTANAYVINSQVAWQGERGGRFAAFNAEIIVGESDQTTPVDELIEQAKKLERLPIPEAGERVLVGNENLDPPDQQELELP